MCQETFWLKKDKLCKFSPNDINYATQKLFSQKHLSINSGESEKRRTLSWCNVYKQRCCSYFYAQENIFSSTMLTALNILESLEPTYQKHYFSLKWIYFKHSTFTHKSSPKYKKIH